MLSTHKYLAPSGAFFHKRSIMAYTVNFKEFESADLETSPVAEVLASLRANEACYFWNKYKQEYVVYTPEEKPEILPFIEKVLAERFVL